MPSRRDIDPVALGPKLLPHITLLDVVAGERFRFRLCGTGIAVAAGGNLAGKFVDQLSSDAKYSCYVIGIYRRVHTALRPVYSETLYRAVADGPPRRARRLLCPLSDDGVTMQGLIGAQTFELLSGTLPPKSSYVGDFTPGSTQVL